MKYNVLSETQIDKNMFRMENLKHNAHVAAFRSYEFRKWLMSVPILNKNGRMFVDLQSCT